ncbi:hypothetical protein D9M68_896250 [compost metagenome]
MPSHRWVPALSPCPCAVTCIISTMPATVSSKPGTSERQRKPFGLPSSMIHNGMLPMMSTGSAAPAA